MHFKRRMAFNMHKITFFPEKKTSTLHMYQNFSDSVPKNTNFLIWSNVARFIFTVIKGEKIRNRYNQAPYLTQGTTWESDKYTI